MLTKIGFFLLSRAIRKDPAYAASWHDNISVAAQDEGASWEVANRSASRFMMWAFQVETGDHLISRQNMARKETP